MSNIIYDIRQFYWNKSTNSFYQDAWNLYPIEGNYHCAFPNLKQQFFIQNGKTEGFRRFRFIEEKWPDWIFESEDGIKCIIRIQDDDPLPEFPEELFDRYDEEPKPKNFFQKFFSAFNIFKTKKDTQVK
jgi:hypothetical protein